MEEQNLAFLIFKMLSGTPTWVWCILAYLLLVGIRAFNTRTVYIPKLFIIPIILSGLKYKTLIEGSSIIFIGYFICLSLSTFLSFKNAAKQKIQIIPERIEVKLSGTYFTLVILILFFIVKYSFVYISATQHNLYSKIAIFEMCLNGIFSGYFLGKAFNYLHSYMKLKQK